MITKYTQLTGRYLKASKKRTILTILGIILSVSLISSIGLFMKGIQHQEIENVKSTDGSYDLLYKHADEHLLAKIKNNPMVIHYGYMKNGHEIRVLGDLTVKEISGTNNALNLLPYKIKKGRLPQKKGEAAVEQWVLNEAFKDAKIGDTIHLKNKEFTLVGILENKSENQFFKKGILLTKNDNELQANQSLLVEVNSKANLRMTVDELKKLTAKGNAVENSHLLIVKGAAGNNSSYRNMYLVVAIVIAIVVLSTIAVIYNSFQISMVERIKQFGLLRAVGTTPKQIRTIVFREATILAVIGVPIGLFFGVVAIFGISEVFKVVGGDTVIFMKPVVDSSILIGSGIIGIASVYLSALLPSIHAGKISPLVAISSRNAITKEKVKKRKLYFVRRLFGFEAYMALKNMKRNRKRYRITVFSVVISVTLFITFYSFVSMTMNVSAPPNELKNIHFTLYFDQQSKMNDEIFQSLKGLKDTKEIYKNYPLTQINAFVDPGSKLNQVKQISGVYHDKKVNGITKTLIHSSIGIYGENALKAANKFLKAGSINRDKLNQEDGVILIEKNTIYNPKAKAKYVGPVANLKVGDEIGIQLIDMNGQLGDIKKTKILAILKDAPFENSGYSSGLMLVTTQKAAEDLCGIKNIEPNGYSMKIRKIKNEKRAEKSIEQVIAGKKNVNVVNNIDQNRREKSSLLMIQILLYGFVVVVSLIGSVNIINTITTNILLRKKEFATLKSIGLTQKGLSKMIVYEGLLYSIFGTIYGSIIGSGFSYVIYREFQGVREFAWHIPWFSIAIAGAVALLIGYLSVLSPLSRIKKDNIIDIIREDY